MYARHGVRYVNTSFNIRLQSNFSDIRAIDSKSAPSLNRSRRLARRLAQHISRIVPRVRDLGRIQDYSMKSTRSRPISSSVGESFKLEVFPCTEVMKHVVKHRHRTLWRGILFPNSVSWNRTIALSHYYIHLYFFAIQATAVPSHRHDQIR